VQLRAARTPARSSNFHYVFYNIIQSAKNSSLPLLSRCHHSLEKQGQVLLAGPFGVPGLTWGNCSMLGTLLLPASLPPRPAATPAAHQGCGFWHRCPLPLGSPSAPLLCSPLVQGTAEEMDLLRWDGELMGPAPGSRAGCAGWAAAASLPAPLPGRTRGEAAGSASLAHC